MARAQSLNREDGLRKCFGRCRDSRLRSRRSDAQAAQRAWWHLLGAQSPSVRSPKGERLKFETRDIRSIRTLPLVPQWLALFCFCGLLLFKLTFDLDDPPASLELRRGETMLHRNGTCVVILQILVQLGSGVLPLPAEPVRELIEALLVAFRQILVICKFAAHSFLLFTRLGAVVDDFLQVLVAKVVEAYQHLITQVNLQHVHVFVNNLKLELQPYIEVVHALLEDALRKHRGLLFE